jgi:hypothetical protein
MSSHAGAGGGRDLLGTVRCKVEGPQTGEKVHVHKLSPGLVPGCSTELPDVGWHWILRKEVDTKDRVIFTKCIWKLRGACCGLK